MSASLVEAKTINKIIAQLDASFCANDGHRKRCETDLGIDLSGPADWKTNLGQRMLDLNQLSLKYRYGDKKRDLICKYEPVDCTRLEAFKALQCWLYQCAEGDIPENAWLYKWFNNTIKPEWAIFLVMKMPEYDAVKWG